MKVQQKNASTVVVTLQDGTEVEIGETSLGLHVTAPHNKSIVVRPHAGNHLTLSFESGAFGLGAAPGVAGQQRTG